ncbi:MAG TPA: hypothetical protein DCY74_06770 [Clostridiales bacterium]|nr:hypothetical protein [Clostridiales bacterium]
MEYYNIFMKPEFISTELINQENAFEMLTLTMFEEFRASFDAGSPMVRFAGAEIRLIESIIAGILDEHTNKKIGYKVMLKSYMTALITHTFRKMSLVQEENERVRLEEVLRYIEENCEQKLTLGMLAEQCFYNPSYFSRMFKEYSGVTLTDFIHASRIKKACELLEKTTLTVESIGFGVGYSDKTMFYRQFKKRMGMLPSAFRK